MYNPDSQRDYLDQQAIRCVVVCAKAGRDDHKKRDSGLESVHKRALSWGRHCAAVTGSGRQEGCVR